MKEKNVVFRPLWDPNDGPMKEREIVVRTCEYLKAVVRIRLQVDKGGKQQFSKLAA
jgi:hypothetical protein